MWVLLFSAGEKFPHKSKHIPKLFRSSLGCSVRGVSSLMQENETDVSVQKVGNTPHYYHHPNLRI